MTRNLLRIAISNISYIRGLFPEKYFNDKSVPALEMKIKNFMPIDTESRRLIDWMEKGVYDALQKKYLKTLRFCVCDALDGPMIEEYASSFNYFDFDEQEISMNINRTGNKKQGGTFKCNSTTEITPQQMRNSACKMIRTLIQLMRTPEKMPKEPTILMKLLYYDDVTPADYEPPFFRGCTEEEANHAWAKNPLKMEVGNVNSKHFVLALKAKSVPDPCEDDNEVVQDDMSRDDTDSEVDHSQGDQYVVAPIDKQQDQEDNNIIDEVVPSGPIVSEEILRAQDLYNNSPALPIPLRHVKILAAFWDMDNLWSRGFDPASVYRYIHSRLKMELKGKITFEKLEIYGFGYCPDLGFNTEILEAFRLNGIHFTATHLGGTDHVLKRYMVNWAKNNNETACVSLWTGDIGFQPEFLYLKLHFGYTLMLVCQPASTSSDWQKLLRFKFVDLMLNFNSISPPAPPRRYYQPKTPKF